jgi:hypothetical protein
MLPLKYLLLFQLNMYRTTSNRTLLWDEDGPTTAHVSDSWILQVKSLKYGDTVSPRGYMVALSKIIRGAPVVPFATEEN